MVKLENKFFYCYSVRMKDFLKSQGICYITKALNPKSKRPYFMFEKSQNLDIAINKWNDLKK
jgi:hypothetical protein